MPSLLRCVVGVTKAVTIRPATWRAPLGEQRHLTDNTRRHPTAFCRVRFASNAVDSAIYHDSMAQKAIPRSSIDAMLEALNGFDELTLRVHVDKDVAMGQCPLLNVKQLEALSVPELRHILVHAAVPRACWPASDSDLRSAVRNLMLALTGLMNTRELQTALNTLQWCTAGGTREDMQVALRWWVQRPDSRLFSAAPRVSQSEMRQAARLHRDPGKLHLFFHNEIRAMPIVTLRELLKQRGLSVADSDTSTGSTSMGLQAEKSRSEVCARLIGFQEYLLLHEYTDADARSLLSAARWTRMLDVLSPRMIRRRCVLYLRHPNVMQFIRKFPYSQRPPIANADADKIIMNSYRQAEAQCRRLQAWSRRQSVIGSVTGTVFPVSGEETAEIGVHDVAIDSGVAAQVGSSALSTFVDPVERELENVDSDLRVSSKSLLQAIPVLSYDGSTCLWNYADELAWQKQPLDIWRVMSSILGQEYGIGMPEHACRSRVYRLMITSAESPATLSSASTDSPSSHATSQIRALPAATPGRRMRRVLEEHNVNTAAPWRSLNIFDYITMEQLNSASALQIVEWLAERSQPTNGAIADLRSRLAVFQEFLVQHDFAHEELCKLLKSAYFTRSGTIKYMRYRILLRLYYPRFSSYYDRPLEYLRRPWTENDIQMLRCAVANANKISLRISATQSAEASATKLPILLLSQRVLCNHKLANFYAQSPFYYWHLVAAIMKNDHDIWFNSIQCRRRWNALQKSEERNLTVNESSMSAATGCEDVIDWSVLTVPELCYMSSSRREALILRMERQPSVADAMSLCGAHAGLNPTARILKFQDYFIRRMMHIRRVKKELGTVLWKCGAGDEQYLRLMLLWYTRNPECDSFLPIRQRPNSFDPIKKEDFLSTVDAVNILRHKMNKPVSYKMELEKMGAEISPLRDTCIGCDETIYRNLTSKVSHSPSVPTTTRLIQLVAQEKFNLAWSAQQVRRALSEFKLFERNGQLATVNYSPQRKSDVNHFVESKAPKSSGTAVVSEQAAVKSRPNVKKAQLSPTTPQDIQKNIFLFGQMQESLPKARIAQRSHEIPAHVWSSLQDAIEGLSDAQND